MALKAVTRQCVWFFSFSYWNNNITFVAMVLLWGWLIGCSPDSGSCLVSIVTIRRQPWDLLRFPFLEWEAGRESLDGGNLCPSFKGPLRCGGTQVRNKTLKQRFKLGEHIHGHFQDWITAQTRREHGVRELFKRLQIISTRTSLAGRGSPVPVASWDCGLPCSWSHGPALLVGAVFPWRL